MDCDRTCESSSQIWFVAMLAIFANNDQIDAIEDNPLSSQMTAL